jgi:pyruvate dehydrogenase E1 component beta subunit
MPTITYRDALNQALREEMQRDPKVFLMGEEVGLYQGAYKVSRGLLEEFGAQSVVDTPIAELGFAGVGVGAAMGGLRPVIEFMTWNFAVLALDQIVNSAAKMLYMSGGQIPIPIVFRGPNGAALQLSSQHSQAWESWLAHIPGLKVVAPATPYDAKGLLKSAIRDNNPVIVLEGEMLYNTKGEIPDGEILVPIGLADVKREGKDVTLICHSKTVTVALKAADQLALQGVAAEVVDLRSLRPLDEHAILTSVAKTNRAVVVEEGWPHCGIGAQVVDIIQRDAFDLLDAPVQRVTQADVPMPYNKQLERLAKPSIERSSRQRGGSCTSTKAMATKVVMEALSPTMEEGRLVKWAKRAGDAVKTGETLAEVETDKAVMELVARADGQLLQQLAPEGDRSRGRSGRLHRSARGNRRCGGRAAGRGAPGGGGWPCATHQRPARARRPPGGCQHASGGRGARRCDTGQSVSARQTHRSRNGRRLARGTRLRTGWSRDQARS